MTNLRFSRQWHAVPLHSARVARNASNALRERFGRTSRAGRHGSLVRSTPRTSTSAPALFFLFATHCPLNLTRMQLRRTCKLKTAEDRRQLPLSRPKSQSQLPTPVISSLLVTVVWFPRIVRQMSALTALRVITYELQLISHVTSRDGALLLIILLVKKC